MTGRAADLPVNGRGTPARLSTDTIVTTAMKIVDTLGVARLTMRHLGTALGVQAMSVYRYFPSRRALLDAVVDEIGAETAADLAAELGTADDWRAYLDALAHRLRKMALTQPDLFLLVASHPTAVSWMRPPIRTVSEVDVFAQRLIDGHFSPDATAAAYKRFTAFLLGHLSYEVRAHNSSELRCHPSERRDQPTRHAATDLSADGADLGSHPYAADLRLLLAADTDTADFECALRRVLDELAGLRHR